MIALFLTRACSYTVWFDKIDRLPYLLYTMKQNARKQQIESILKYAREKGLNIPAEIAKTPELHRITYVGSKILADQLVFSSLCVSTSSSLLPPPHPPSSPPAPAPPPARYTTLPTFPCFLQLHSVLLLRSRSPQRIHDGRVQRGGETQVCTDVSSPSASRLYFSVEPFL